MNDDWHPHLTVATIIENQGKFLMVKEISNGEIVFNQPAGHVEKNENLMAAAIRETLEETGWHVTIKELVGFYLYTSPQSQTTYFRALFTASPDQHDPQRTLDEGILDAPWLSLEQIKEKTSTLRSPMVLQCIEDYLSGKRLPLNSISHVASQ
jgi:8-oxo-dGTP pyrophosphatase MutT (NUDIX family)